MSPSDKFDEWMNSDAARRMREAIDKNKREHRLQMTPERALFVRHLRSSGYTWRAVAAATCKEWGGDWDSNQIDGMHICEVAAEFLGEDPNSPPWN